tara:strand:- start:1011 stop:1262 length:252 start_codon:yes stop_codon:yes gene_type:complete
MKERDKNLLTDAPVNEPKWAMEYLLDVKIPADKLANYIMLSAAEQDEFAVSVLATTVLYDLLRAEGQEPIVALVKAIQMGGTK